MSVQQKTVYENLHNSLYERLGFLTHTQAERVSEDYACHKGSRPFSLVDVAKVKGIGPITLGRFGNELRAACDAAEAERYEHIATVRDNKPERDRLFIFWHRPTSTRPTPLVMFNRIISDGVVGRIHSNNVALTCYAEYPCHLRPRDMDLMGRIKGVRVSLSGQTFTYDLYRVE